MKLPIWLLLLLLLAGYLFLGVGLAWDIHDATIIAMTLFSTSLLLGLVWIGYDIRRIVREAAQP